MFEKNNLNDPWLVAAWPGIGNVAVGAAAYLIEQLGATLVHELPASDYFSINQVAVDQGIAKPVSLPRCMIFESRIESASHDLIIFLGEAQPASDGNALCRQVLDFAIDRGISRVITFAALATQLHPSATPRVFIAATDQPQLDEFNDPDVEILDNGLIGGLNGLMLATCSERDLPGVCLLGELPFFAATIQNPKATKAVLEVFSRLSGITIDYRVINEAADATEDKLLELLKQMQDDHKLEPHTPSTDEAYIASDYHTDDAEQDSAEVETAHILTETELRNIEELFEKARQDQSTAFKLKQELDRLSVFDLYQDSFLDLFKRAE